MKVDALLPRELRAGRRVVWRELPDSAVRLPVGDRRDPGRRWWVLFLELDDGRPAVPLSRAIPAELVGNLPGAAA